MGDERSQGKQGCASNLEWAMLVGGALVNSSGNRQGDCWGSQVKVIKPLICVSTFPQRGLPLASPQPPAHPELKPSS